MENNKRMVRSRAVTAEPPLLSLGEWPTVILSQSLNCPGIRLLTRGVIIEAAEYFPSFGEAADCLPATITLLKGGAARRPPETCVLRALVSPPLFSNCIMVMIGSRGWRACQAAV
jgi:hypothetical protein